MESNPPRLAHELSDMNAPDNPAKTPPGKAETPLTGCGGGLIAGTRLLWLVTLLLPWSGVTQVLGQSPAGRPASPQEAPARLNATPTNLEEALNAGNAELFSRMFAQELFAREVMEGIETGGNLSEELSRALAQAVGSGILFIQWSPGNRFEYLGEKQVDGRTGQFYRCILANGTLNYFTFFTDYSAEGNAEMVTDIYNHRTAQYRGIIAQQALVMAAGKTGLLKPEQMSGMPLGFADHQKLALMAANLVRGQLPKVRQVYQQLSQKAQKRPMAVMLYMASCTADDTLWQQARDLAEQLIPQALGPDLMATDRLTAREQWRESIPLYQSMLPRTNNDPYLHFRVARCLYELGSYADAGKTALRALRLEPDMVSPYMLLMEIELKRGNFDGAFRLLKLLGDRFNVLVENQQFQDDPAYEAFRESNAYAEWLKYRKTRAAQLEQAAGR
jgi:tetratricopeptide (TPR) repeat protein